MHTEPSHAWTPPAEQDRPEPTADAPQAQPHHPKRVFAVLLREAVETFAAEHGHEPTPEERASIKQQLRTDRPDLAWSG
jgi:hypothetical protein